MLFSVVSKVYLITAHNYMSIKVGCNFLSANESVDAVKCDLDNY